MKITEEIIKEFGFTVVAHSSNPIYYTARIHGVFFIIGYEDDKWSLRYDAEDCAPLVHGLESVQHLLNTVALEAYNLGARDAKDKIKSAIGMS